MDMRFIITSCALAFGWGVCVSAQGSDFQSPLLGHFEAGVICAIQGGDEREAPNTVAGTTHLFTDTPTFISKDLLVPAVIGVGFGVRSGLRGDLRRDGVVLRLTHPPFDGVGAMEQSFTTWVGSEFDPSFTIYQFDEPYELALGQWTMTASMGAVTLYETTFTVVPPQALPNLAAACGYLDLLS